MRRPSIAAAGRLMERLNRAELYLSRWQTPCPLPPSDWRTSELPFPSRPKRLQGLLDRRATGQEVLHQLTRWGPSVTLYSPDGPRKLHFAHRMALYRNSDLPRKIGVSVQLAPSRSDSRRNHVTPSSAGWASPAASDVVKEKRKKKRVANPKFADRPDRPHRDPNWPYKRGYMSWKTTCPRELHVLEKLMSTGQSSVTSAPAGAVPALPAPRRALARSRIDDLGRGWGLIPGKRFPRILEALAGIFGSRDFSRFPLTSGRPPTIPFNRRI